MRGGGGTEPTLEAGDDGEGACVRNSDIKLYFIVRHLARFAVKRGPHMKTKSHFKHSSCTNTKQIISKSSLFF